MLFFLFSLGCKVNSYENDTLRETLIKQGNQETEDPSLASLIVLNTCSVTATADQKSRQHLRKLRRAAPQAVILVMGCYSETHGQECLDMGADIVLGTAGRNRVLPDYESFVAKHEKILDIPSDVRHLPYEEMGPMALSDNARAALKIQDGCDNFCSYCLIPFLRGNSRSRAKEDALREFCRLVEAGYHEIIIAGIHIGSYGKDLGEGNYRLGDLLEDMLSLAPQLARLRISSIEESEISPKILEVLSKYPTIVDHLHIPLQSGSSSVLARMKRKYDTAAFLGKLREIRAIRPRIAITTDVIVGFPSEGEEEWQETMDFCRTAHFAEIHVFPFSSRKGTAAASLQELPPEVKERRVHELLSLSQKSREEYEQGFLHQELSVLFEDFDPERKLAYGHSGNYLLLKKASAVDLHGKIERVLYDENSKAD
jgi:threonylcarbamoyladenosine tRNA methylthiotransferase MtaB